MGWLCDQMAAFAGLVIADPKVLLQRDASTPDGLPSTLDHAPWSEPKLFDAINTLRPELPHLLDIISRMFDSALGKWVTFCSEFNAGSTINRLTQEQIKVSLGACGSMDSAWTGAPVARIVYSQSSVARDLCPSI
jgi:hypothetical protein